MLCPALSPNRNPIENLWDQIQRKMDNEQPKPITVTELRVWASIPMVLLIRMRKVR